MLTDYKPTINWLMFTLIIFLTSHLALLANHKI